MHFVCAMPSCRSFLHSKAQPSTSTTWGPSTAFSCDVSAASKSALLANTGQVRDEFDRRASGPCCATCVPVCKQNRRRMNAQRSAAVVRLMPFRSSGHVILATLPCCQAPRDRFPCRWASHKLLKQEQQSLNLVRDASSAAAHPTLRTKRTACHEFA